MAGWKHQSTYWNRKGWEHATFLWLWQGSHPSFEFSCTTSPDLSGLHVITYPVGYTKLLRYPYTEEECKVLGIAYVPLTDEDHSERKLLKGK